MLIVSSAYVQAPFKQRGFLTYYNVLNQLVSHLETGIFSYVYPGYGTKLHLIARLQFGRLESTFSLSLLSGPLGYGVVVPVTYGPNRFI